MRTDGGSVYFAHCEERQAIKVGWSSAPERRANQAHWELIGFLPGSTASEAAVHWALRPYRLDGEWFRSCPAVWRFAFELIAAQRLNWMPPQPDRYDSNAARELRAQAKDHFGTCAAAAEAIGAAHTGFSTTYGIPFVVWARLHTEIAREGGLLPTYLINPVSPPARPERRSNWTPERRAQQSATLKEAWERRRARLSKKAA